MKKLAITAAVLGLVLLSSMFVSAMPPTPPNPPLRSMQLYEARAQGDGPVTVDYSAAYDTASSELIQNTMDTLITFNGEHQDQFLPSIATSWNVTPLGDYVKGIDVSHYDSPIDWNEVALDPQHIKFAFVKATDGKDADPKFTDNMKRTKGLDMGPYHFAYPKLRPTQAGANLEADAFYNVAKDYLNYGLLPALDIEEDGTGIIADANASGWKWLSDWANWWMLRFKEKSGGTALIYINSYYASHMTGAITDYPLWIADYSQSPPRKGNWKDWDYCQYSNTGTVSGVSNTGHTDMNVAHYRSTGIDSGNPIEGLLFENPESQTGSNAKYYYRYFFRITPGRVNFGPPYNYSLTPEDVAYSFQRTMIMDMASGPQWMLQEPLLDNAAGDDVSAGGIADLTNPTQVAELGALIRDSVQYNDTDVWFNLMWPGAYAPFLQILCQTWSSIESKQWIVNQVIGSGRPDWDGDWSSTTAWLAFHKPATSPLDTPTPLMYGSGPFVITTLDYASSYWSGTRNVNYWRGWPADFPLMANAKPAGYVDEIYVTWANAWATRLGDFTSGDADFVAVPRGNLADVFQSSSPPFAPPNYPQDGIRCIYPLPELSVDAFFFDFDMSPATIYGPVGPPGVFNESNVPSDFFGNPTWGIHVRKGFAWAFDYATFISTAFLGEAIHPATAIIPGLLYYDPTVKGYTYDLTAALAEFNAVPGLSTTGFTMTLLYTGAGGARQTACNLLKTAVESLNPRYHINLESVVLHEYLNAVEAGWLPMFQTGWKADFPDAHDFAQPFYSTEGFFASWQGYSNPEMDDLVNAGVAQPDGPARAAIYRQIQQLAIADVPDFTLDQIVGRHFERDWVVGWYYNPAYQGINFYNLWKWYYAPQVNFNPPTQPMSFNLPADINYDGKVDIKDVCTAAKSFGTSAGPPLDARWVFRADTNNDRKIDIKDVSYVARYFGPTTYAVWIPY